jgi:hypothetical protein
MGAECSNEADCRPMPWDCMSMSVTPGGREHVPGAPAVKVQNVESKPLLHRAALMGSVVELEALIAQGADVDAVDSQRMTALHMASANGHMVISSPQPVCMGTCACMLTEGVRRKRRLS